MWAATALSTKRKAGPGGGERRAHRGYRSVSLFPPALCPAVGTSAAGAALDFSRDDGCVHITTISSSFPITRFPSLGGGGPWLHMHESPGRSPPNYHISSYAGPT